MMWMSMVMIMEIRGYEVAGAEDPDLNWTKGAKAGRMILSSFDSPKDLTDRQMNFISVGPENLKRNRFSMWAGKRSSSDRNLLNHLETYLQGRSNAADGGRKRYFSSWAGKRTPEDDRQPQHWQGRTHDVERLQPLRTLDDERLEAPHYWESL